MYFVSNIQSGYLENQEAIHCLKVLRKQVGDILEVTNGKGSFYKVQLTNTSNKKAHFKILETQNVVASKTKLHLYFSPVKQASRNEWLLEKCTEIGINEFTPIICENSERRKINTERLNKILISAIKQSRRALLPVLNNMISFTTSLDTLGESEKYLASYNSKQSNLEEVLIKNKNTVIFIGPEGDFSEKEKNLAKKYNFNTVNLGNYRLRTETACVVATHLFNILNK